MSTFREIVAILSFGYVCYFFSERVFWSFLRPYPEDQWTSFFLTWAIYSLLGLLAIGLIRRYRVIDTSRLFLVGAIYGWVAEGAVVATMYGTSLGIWATLSFTGLAWHALLTAIIGWLLFPLCFSAQRTVRQSIRDFSLVGIAWGIWALNWGYEGKGWDVSLNDFLLHSFLYSIPLPVAYYLFFKNISFVRTPNRLGWGIIIGSFATLYLYWNFTLPIFPISLLLPLLLFLTIFALQKNAQLSESSYIDRININAFSWKRAGLFLLTPMLASITYALFLHAFGPMHTNWLIFLLTMPAGYAAYFWSIYRALRQGDGALKKQCDLSNKVFDR